MNESINKYSHIYKWNKIPLLGYENNKKREFNKPKTSKETEDYAG